MQILTLTFSDPINASLQIGDTAYFMPTGTSGGFATAALGDVIAFGTVSSIVNPLGLLPGPIMVMVYYDNNSGIPIPTMSDFIMFGKDKTVNSSSLIGYYADIKFVNNSDQKVELFSVGSEVVESSK
jgi:hypothetical protein